MNEQMAELEIKKSRRARFESRFEHLLWRFRLVTILPVLMSLLGSVSCFILGTQEEIHALNKLFFQGYLDSEKSILLLGKAVGGHWLLCDWDCPAYFWIWRVWADYFWYRSTTSRPIPRKTKYPEHHLTWRLKTKTYQCYHCCINRYSFQAND